MGCTAWSFCKLCFLSGGPAEARCVFYSQSYETLNSSKLPDAAINQAPEMCRHICKRRSPKCAKRKAPVDSYDLHLATLKSLFPHMDETVSQLPYILLLLYPEECVELLVDFSHSSPLQVVSYSWRWCKLAFWVFTAVMHSSRRIIRWGKFDW